MTKAELLQFLESIPGNPRVMVFGPFEPDPISLDGAIRGDVDGEDTILLKLSSVRVSWDGPSVLDNYPGQMAKTRARKAGYEAGLRRAQELAKDHALPVPRYIDEADIDWEDFDQSIAAEITKGDAP